MAVRSSYPSPQPGLNCILTRHQPALFSSNESHKIPSLVGYFTLMVNSTAVVVTEVEEDGWLLKFNLTGVEPCIANCIRRSLLCEVPSMAAETIMMLQNTSIFTDDNIGSRMGLIPFGADSRKFKFRQPRTTVEHPDSTLIFDLSIPATKTVSTRTARKDTKQANVNVYSRSLKLIPHPAMKPDDEKRFVRPISENILIATLLPSQELMLKLHVIKGIGKDHAKFSPVATAMFRPKPELTLLRDVFDEEAKRLQALMPNGLIGLENDRSGREKAVVNDSRLYSGSRGVLKDPTLFDSLQIAFRENEFEFTVESVGALPAAVLVTQAIDILKNRCEYLLLISPKESNWNNIKAEEIF